MSALVARLRAPRVGFRTHRGGGAVSLGAPFVKVQNEPEMDGLALLPSQGCEKRTLIGSLNGPVTPGDHSCNTLYAVGGHVRHNTTHNVKENADAATVVKGAYFPEHSGEGAAVDLYLRSYLWRFIVYIQDAVEAGAL